LSNLLGQMLSAESQQQLDATDKMMDLVLRIITSSTGAPESIDLGNGPTAARHRLLDVISLALQSVERQLSSDEEVHVLGDLEPPQSGSLLRIVLKLLKFTLGLGRSEVNMLTTPRADFGKLAMSFLRVVSVRLTAFGSC
jgi:mediator of RNA polymerase II transcription subunit 12